MYMYMHVLYTKQITYQNHKKGISELLKQACTEVREGNCNIKQQVKDIGGKFLNNVEIRTQKAVYITLQ